MADYFNKLTSLITGKKPDPKMLGEGMAQSAGNALANRGYKLHVEEAMSTGEEPMTPEEFRRSQQTASIR